MRLKLHWFDLLSTCFTNKFATNRTSGVWALVYCIAWLACIAIGATNRGPTYRPHCWMQISTVNQPWHNFSKSRIVHGKMCHVSPTLHPLGVICYPYARTCYDQCLWLQVLTILSVACSNNITIFQHFRDIINCQNLKRPRDHHRFTVPTRGIICQYEG